MGYSGSLEFAIRYKKWRGIAGNFREDTIQGILFEIFSMEYYIEIYITLMSIYNKNVKVIGVVRENIIDCEPDCPKIIFSSLHEPKSFHFISASTEK